MLDWAAWAAFLVEVGTIEAVLVTSGESRQHKTGMGMERRGLVPLQSLSPSRCSRCY